MKITLNDGNKQVCIKQLTLVLNCRLYVEEKNKFAILNSPTRWRPRPRFEISRWSPPFAGNFCSGLCPEPAKMLQTLTLVLYGAQVHGDRTRAEGLKLHPSWWMEMRQKQETVDVCLFTELTSVCRGLLNGWPLSSLGAASWREEMEKPNSPEICHCFHLGMHIFKHVCLVYC